MRDERGPWYLLTALVLGLAIGLYYSMKVDPVRYVNIEPSSLQQVDQDRYRALIASAYAADQNLERAKQRLALLNDSDPASTLTLQASRAVQEGRPASEINALGMLAVAISQGSQVSAPNPQPLASATLTLTPASPTPAASATLTQPAISPSPPSITATATITVTSPGRTLAPTTTPLPTRTATPTPGAPFVLQKEAQLVCDPSLSEPFIQIEAQDAAGNPVPGVEVIVNWQGGEEHFFTGLKPDISPGYADFLMTPGVVYSLHLADGGESVPGITPNECEKSDGTRYWGSWKLIFVQP
jgi:hypothetical protein